MNERNFIVTQSVSKSKEIIPSGAMALFSDPHEVLDEPRLRRLDLRTVVEGEAMGRAPRPVDGPAPYARHRGNWLPFASHRRSVISSLLRRGVAPMRSRDDDDEDPPPAPAGRPVRFRPAFVTAYRASSEDWKTARAAG